MLFNVDFRKGNIIYNEFNIDFDISFVDQEDSLTEDLLQVEYSGNYLIDLGWYPECNHNGHFVVCVINNYNWEEAVYKKKMTNQNELIDALLEAIDIVSRLTE